MRTWILTATLAMLFVAGCAENAAQVTQENPIPLRSLSDDALVEAVIYTKGPERTQAGAVLMNRGRSAWEAILPRLAKESLKNDEQSEEAKLVLLDVLSTVGRPEDDNRSSTFVRSALLDTSPAVRAGASWVLTGQYEGWEPEVADYLDDEGEISWRAASLLLAFENPAGQEFILNKLQSKDTTDKERSLILIERYRQDALAEYAPSLLNDLNGQVRARAARVVGIFGNKDDAELLHPLLNDTAAIARGHAALAIAALARNESASMLREALQKETDPEAKVLIRQAIIIAGQPFSGQSRNSNRTH